MAKSAGITIVAIIALSAIIITLIIVLATQRNSAQSTAQNGQNQNSTASQTNQALQDCMNQAHQQWDGDIAVTEGSPGNAYSFDKSQLDQQLVDCHDQYGY